MNVVDGDAEVNIADGDAEVNVADGDAEVNVVDVDAEVNVGYDDADDSDADSLRLVLTDSAVSSVSQKKSSFEDDDDDDDEEQEMSNGKSPVPPPTPSTTTSTTASATTAEKIPEPVARSVSDQPEKTGRNAAEVFNHSTLPPPLPPRDNFLNTPMYFSASSDNFLQTPVHPFHFTEEEIEQVSSATYFRQPRS